MIEDHHIYSRERDSFWQGVIDGSITMLICCGLCWVLAFIMGF